MNKQIKIVGVKRKEIDEEKLALAFLLLAKTLQEHKRDTEPGADTAPARRRAEAA